jgi:hypothetical protein
MNLSVGTVFDVRPSTTSTAIVGGESDDEQAKWRQINNLELKRRFDGLLRADSNRPDSQPAYVVLKNDAANYQLGCVYVG